VRALSLSSFLFWRRGLVRGLRPKGPEAAADGLGAFAAEREAGGSAQPDHSSARRGQRWAIFALAVIALVEAPLAGLWLYERWQPDSTEAARLPQPHTLPAVPLAVPPPVMKPIDSVAMEDAAVATSLAASGATNREPERASRSAAMGGWVSVKTPVPMQVFEEGRLVGTTDVDRIMLPVGTHRLEIVSEMLGYRSRQDVAIRAGETSTLRVPMPTAALAVNALPWAEVWVDGEHVGETPIGNLTRTIGPHEIVFRHPDLGEKKTTVIVTLKEPARVGVDLRSK
jgi:hypothetical protein